jgi:hypothetical protein
MQLQHSGVILSVLTDYCNRMRHIKRRTEENTAVQKGGNPRDLQTESSKQSVIECTWTVPKFGKLDAGPGSNPRSQCDICDGKRENVTWNEKFF